MVSLHVHGYEGSGNHLNSIFTFLVFVVLTDLLFVVFVTLFPLVKVTTCAIVFCEFLELF